MGLDMFLEGRKYHRTDWDHPENNPSEDGFKVKETVLELGYWRKHPNLHGYIVQTFAGGEDECQRIPLTENDIENIIAAVRERRLPHTDGFFFGTSDNTEDEAAVDIKIFEDALAWLKAPDKKHWRDVIYQASW